MMTEGTPISGNLQMTIINGYMGVSVVGHPKLAGWFILYGKSRLEMDDDLGVSPFMDLPTIYPLFTHLRLYIFPYNMHYSKILCNFPLF